MDLAKREVLIEFKGNVMIMGDVDTLCLVENDQERAQLNRWGSLKNDSIWCFIHVYWLCFSHKMYGGKFSKTNRIYLFIDWLIDSNIKSYKAISHLKLVTLIRHQALTCTPDLSSALTTKYSYSASSTCPSLFVSHSFIHTLISSSEGW